MLESRGFSQHDNSESVDESQIDLIKNLSVFLNISEEAVKSVRYHKHASLEFKPMTVPVGKILPLTPIPNSYTCFLLCTDYIWMQGESEVVGRRDCRNPALNPLKLLWNPALKGRSLVAAGSVVEQEEHWIFWEALRSFWYSNEFLLPYIGMPLNRHIFLLWFCLKKYCRGFFLGRLLFVEAGGGGWKSSFFPVSHLGLFI